MSDINYNAASDSNANAKQGMLVKHPFLLRVLYTLGFAVMAWLLLWFVFAVTLLQIVVTLVTGQRNEQIAEFGTKLSWWMRDLLRFLTGATSDLPFPLGPFPTL